MDLGTAPWLLAEHASRPGISHSDRGFAYQPALDGVRALAVGMVLLFHAGFEWMSGGYVGVSVFFTLSGFLITSLALVEHDGTGRLGVLAFYSRRVRRLLPASLVCLGGVVVAAWLGQFEGVTHLRRDLWAALLQVYNWFVLSVGESYGTQVSRAVGQRAPLDHYWSLAVEEQFYWVWPLALVLILRLRDRARLMVTGALTAIGVIAAIVTSSVVGADATYFATQARLPEILLGALAAFAMHRRPTRERLRALMAGLSVLGLGVIVAAAVVWPGRGGPAYHGWFPVLGIASVALIVGLQVVSPVRAVLSCAPLVLLGRISYGVYLFHWPIYTLVDERRLEVGQWPLFGVRVAITFTVAGVSYALVERPVRTWRIDWRPTLGGAAVACVAAAVIVGFVPDRGGDYTFVADETRAAAGIPRLAADERLEPLASSGDGDQDGDWSGASLTRPARVMIIGDSTAHSTGEGMIQWAAEHLDVMRVTGSAAVGCGLNSTGLIPDDGFGDVCDEVRGGITRTVAALQPDVVVAMVTFRDMEDRLWLSSEGVLTPTDERFRQHLLDGYEIITKQILEAGAGTVIWVIPPTPALPPIGELAPMLDADRIDAYRRVVRALPVSFPDRVVVADMASWIDRAAEPPERFDGLHWTLDGAVQIADEFLAPAVVSAALTRADGGS